MAQRGPVQPAGPGQGRHVERRVATPPDTRLRTNLARDEGAGAVTHVDERVQRRGEESSGKLERGEETREG